MAFGNTKTDSATLPLKNSFVMTEWLNDSSLAEIELKDKTLKTATSEVVQIGQNPQSQPYPEIADI